MIKSLVLSSRSPGLFDANQPNYKYNTFSIKSAVFLLLNVYENVRNSWDTTYFSYINNVLVTKFKVSIK